MELNIIFNRLWNDYINQNPSAGRIYNLFKDEGEDVVNDHIAFRTIKTEGIDIDVIAKPFTETGYIPKGEYIFKDKHLFAKHFELPGNSLAPRVFNELLKKNGFMLNESGGEVKGMPSDLLQKSSTMADKVIVKFSEGLFEVPCCYYEFAQRYKDSNGELYSGFIAKSADKIFESTNFYTKK